MSEASIIINVSEMEHGHGNGLSGYHIVPARKEGEKFGMLVVYPTPEIQDIGDNKSTVHCLKSRPLAMDICGMRSDVKRDKWGVLLCEAEPDIPKALEKAIEAEMEFLNENPPQTRYVRKANLMIAATSETKDVTDNKIVLSSAVLHYRDEFEKHCRTLVKKSEIEKAYGLLGNEYGRLVAEGDMIWARPEDRRDISDLHRRACRSLGQERPWCYTPQQLMDCPVCGGSLKAGVALCSHCNAILDAAKAAKYGIQVPPMVEANPEPKEARGQR